MEKTKPTPTLAKLYVSQEKFAYALAIYLYLQEKEGKSYFAEIKAAVTAIVKTKWEDYPQRVKEAFSKDDIIGLRIIPGELQQFTDEALKDISQDFEREAGTPEIIEETETPETELPVTAEEEKLEDKPEEAPPDRQEALEEQARDEIWDEIETTPENEEIPFPKISGEVYQEKKVPVPPKPKTRKKQEEELMPGVKDFTSNYKEAMTKGLIDEATAIKDDAAEKKLQENINEKLTDMLRKLRSMSNDEINALLAKKLSEGLKPEEITLAELEDLID
ncbi:MAG: hypothetical protein K9N06_13360 [Candidatus Cloacimonetes bacterium]|nr:hypothetical protein [Candidatus Cloacimonadota bacterium]